MDYEEKTKGELISELKSLKSKVESLEYRQSEEKWRTSEKTLQQSREKYRRLVENLQDNYFFYAHNTDGIFTYISPSLTNILGYSVEEFLTHYSEYLTDNPINEKVEGHTEGSIKGIKQPPYEVEIYHKDGTVRSLHVQEVPIFDDNRKVIAVEGIAQDITERRKMEKELIKAQKLESIGVFAGGIAHDFNNSLQAILGFVTMARMHTKSKKELHKLLEKAYEAVLQATDLTQQLLTFSKGGEPIKRIISVSELITNSTKLAMSGSSVMCELVIADKLWQIEADKGQLSQVINNLIINADQAMTKGGCIKIQAVNINITKKDSLPFPEGCYVKITVEDSGIGIAQEHLQRIFDPYFTTKQNGSGLGLATVYSIVKKHDGHISVDSEIGVGTTFNIFLSATEKEISKQSVQRKTEETLLETVEEENEEKPVITKGRILLMDDEYVIRNILSEQLKKLKYEVETAKEGSEAIRLYKSASESGKPFDAVIMDLTIAGGMGGKETIKRLLEIDPKVKAIVSSGYANDPVMTDYLKFGFKGLLAKPHEIHELNDELHNVMTMIN